MTMAFDIEAVRNQFPALSKTDNNNARLYLDNPGGTQVPQIVLDEMLAYLTHDNANLGGYFTTTMASGETVSAARAAMADLLNAPSSEEIIFGQNMTSLTLHISRSIGRKLSPGDEIILSTMDHEGNVSPWLLMARDHGLTVKWLTFNPDTFEFDLDELRALVNTKTRLLCISAASNFLGTINDVATATRIAHEAGAWVYVDAVQAVPHVVTDVEAIGCDFLVCSAYKFFGPHQGILWGKRTTLDQLEPYKVRPASEKIPASFETGTQNHEAMAGTKATIEYFANIGRTMGAPWRQHHSAFSGRRQHIRMAMDALFDYELTLTGKLIDGLTRLPTVRVLGITDAQALQRRVPTVSFQVERRSAVSVAQALAKQNIFVWSGFYYAIEAARVLQISDSDGAVRVGPVHYNTEAEIDIFLDALSDIINTE